MNNINFSKGIVFSAMQKYIDIQTLLDTLNISLSEADEFMKTFNREYYPKQMKELEQNMIKKDILLIEILNYIWENINNEALTVEYIIKSLNLHLSKVSLAKMISYNVKSSPDLHFLITINKSLKDDLKTILHEDFSDNFHKKTKLFKGNDFNTNKLKELSETECIEKIAIIFKTSPSIIAQEMIFNNIGGFWHNENIRTNSPFFICDVKETEFSKEELIYIINNHSKITIEDLAEKMHTSKNSIENIINILAKIKNKKNAIELVKTDEVFHTKEWLLIHSIKMTQKENTQIDKYSFADLLNIKETETMEILRKTVLNNMEKIHESVKRKNEKIFLVYLKNNLKEPLIGTINEENTGVTLITEHKNEKSFIFFNDLAIIQPINHNQI